MVLLLAASQGAALISQKPLLMLDGRVNPLEMLGRALARLLQRLTVTV